MDSLKEMKNIIIDNLSTIGLIILKALFVLILGLIFIRLILFFLKRILKVIKVEKLSKKLNEIEIFEGKKLNIKISKIIITFVKWVFLLALIIVVSEMIGLTIVSEGIGSLLSYLPQLLSALVIFMIGLFIANFVKKAIQSFFKSFDLSGSKIVSQLVFFIILTIISITALNQAGVNTEIITDNLTLIFTAFLLSVSLAIGIGARGIVADLLRTFYTRRKYEIGQKIRVKKIEGEIISIDDLSITLKTAKGKFILPIRDIVENKVEILE